jgi:dsRNA-specific ribonuclease
VACVIEGLGIRTEGRGASRRAAEQLAAERALAALAVLDKR